MKFCLLKLLNKSTTINSNLENSSELNIIFLLMRLYLKDLEKEVQLFQYHFFKGTL